MGRSWVLCEGGCRVSNVAKFGDFRRLVVEVLQWSVGVGSFEEEVGLDGRLLWFFLGLLGFSPPVECTRERGRSGVCSGWLPSGFLPQVWFVGFLPLGFSDCLSSCPWQKPRPRFAGGWRCAGAAGLAMVCCRLGVGWWLKKKGGRQRGEGCCNRRRRERNKRRRRNRKEEERRKERKKKRKKNS